MIVKGAKPTGNFTIVRNELFQDKRLTPYAMMILIILLSKPEDWQPSADRIAREYNFYKPTVRKAFNTLIEAGYMTREAKRGDHGRFNTKITVYAQPQTNPSTSTNPTNERERALK